MPARLQPQTTALSRRSFLLTLGGAGVAVAFGGLASVARAAAGDGVVGGLKPNIWVTIEADGTVNLVSPAVEMGQGVKTALPLLIAEEMDAEWEKVHVVQAPSDAERYGNPGFYGIQLTGGSETVRGYYLLLRLAGAQTRQVLLAGAAAQLGMPVGELKTEPGRVVHAGSGRSLSYGQIAATGLLPDPLPQATEADLKPPAQWRYIGRQDVDRIDVPSKVDGSALFGIDVDLPDMLHGAVLRPPVPGERPERIDDSAARAVKGITRIVALPYGVGIIGESTDAVRRAKEALAVTWSATSRVRHYDSAGLAATYREVSRDVSRAGVQARAAGDAPAAITGAARVIVADYVTDHVHHATMEPMNATARVSGDTVELWVSTQGPTATQGFAAAAAGTTPEKVTVHTTLLGGGFGRRAEDDFIADAVLLAREVEGRPVKLLWSREDDVQHGKYRPLAAQHIEVGLDESGALVGWRHRVVADSIFARTLPQMFASDGGLDTVVTDGTLFNYSVPTHLVEFIRQDNGRDVGFWRGVGYGQNTFGVECTLDEVAAAKGVDPVAFRLKLLNGHPRAQKVIETVAGLAEWSRPREGRALGLAYTDAFGAHCAEIVELSLDRESGEIRLHEVWCVIDPGVAVQPRNIEAQVAGAIVFGASHALYEQINIIGGAVQETNFDTYRILRMSEMPRIHVTVTPTPENKPAGIGEVGLPPIGPAIANAVARLTGGVRLRHYPFLPERVKAALAE